MKGQSQGPIPGFTHRYEEGPATLGQKLFSGGADLLYSRQVDVTNIQIAERSVAIALDLYAKLVNDMPHDGFSELDVFDTYNTHVVSLSGDTEGVVSGEIDPESCRMTRTAKCYVGEDNQFTTEDLDLLVDMGLLLDEGIEAVGDGTKQQKRYSINTTSRVAAHLEEYGVLTGIWNAMPTISPEEVDDFDPTDPFVQNRRTLLGSEAFVWPTVFEGTPPEDEE